jgi:hypothetical protein
VHRVLAHLGHSSQELATDALPRAVPTTNSASTQRRCAARSAEGPRHEQKPSAQEVNLGASKHGALEHLQGIDVALDGAGTPTQREAGFDRSIVRASPVAKRRRGAAPLATASASQRSKRSAWRSRTMPQKS